MSAMKDSENNFVFVNLIDTDQLYGHRNNPDGYASCLEEIDRAIPAITAKLNPSDLLIITGDHGNDPTTESTDHAREFVPLLVFPVENANQMELGIRRTFSDIAVSVSEYFGLQHNFEGQSFVNTKKG
jgi:phosphopentomutase